jgi:hypothetical protein
MLKMLRAMPFFRVMAIARTLLLARRHYRRLDAADRRRLAELARRGTGLDAAERDELRRILSKLEPRAFAAAAANTFSPVKIPRWMMSRLER